ncbi:cryptochrome-2-like [Dysidea avara]|uniref:cryptochrome-2-like n=1 Tax=Dysidea avara TaxID=196820 RepID=UPI0033211B25
MTANQDTSIHWFRLDCLRLHDNPALFHSLTAQTIKCVLILDPLCFKDRNRGPSAPVWQFLLESLHDLDSKLRKSPYNSRLFVFKGEPTVILPRLIRHWKATMLTYQASQSSYEAFKYDNIIANVARANGAKVECPFGHTLFSPDTIKQIFGNTIASSVKEFIRAAGSLKPSPPVPQPSHQPSHHIVPLSWNMGSMEPLVPGEVPIPTMNELGFTAEETVRMGSWIGGETQALSRLLNYCCEDHEDKNMLNWLLSKESLSPYFRFGCLSVRLFYARVQKYTPITDEGQKFLCRIKGNLLLREYSYHLAMAIPNFDKQKDNPLCLPIRWKSEKDLVERVGKGQTGIPWIDAVMIQITKEGWAHYLARKCVAYFLTRGCLWQSWECGKAIFSKYLLDYEDPICVVCWIEDACAGLISGKIESFSPCKFGQLMDPEGIYITTYLPALRNFPPEYIHAPWTAPKLIQEEAQCIIGIDYPNPIVDVEAKEYICKAWLKDFFVSLANSVTLSSPTNANIS